MQLISSLGPRFSLGDDVIRCFDKNVETALAYDNVTRVRALRLGGGGVLELSGGDNKKLIVVSSREFVTGWLFKKTYDPLALQEAMLLA